MRRCFHVVDYLEDRNHGSLYYLHLNINKRLNKNDERVRRDLTNKEQRGYALPFQLSLNQLL